MPSNRKIRWLSREDRARSGRGELKPVEIPPPTFDAGNPSRKIVEEVIDLNPHLYLVTHSKKCVFYYK